MIEYSLLDISYAIGILDKKSNAVELIPVPHMFLLEQKSKKTFSVEDDETYKVCIKQTHTQNLDV